MATKKIQIEYDINGKAIDVAIDKTLNLSQKVKELTKELRKAKEGSDEFKLLSSKLGDTQDALAKTTAKSKDLFGSLSMLPGPIGMFFQELSGTIELLKIFSSFSMKDLSFQLGEVANDIGDIGSNLLETNKVAAETIATASQVKSSSVSSKATETEKSTTVATQAQTAAVVAQTSAVQTQTTAIAENNSTKILNNVTIQYERILMENYAESLGLEIKMRNINNITLKEGTVALVQESGAYEILTLEQLRNNIVTSAGTEEQKKNALAVFADAAAIRTESTVTKEATVATNVFSTALKLLPFLAIIAAITLLVVYWQDLIDLITGATNVTKAYGEAQQGATKDLTEFNKKVYEQTNAIKQAKAGVIDKKEALKKYNDTLGSTIGYAKDLNQAETLMAANTKVVVEGIRLRAMANVFYAKAAEASAKAVSGEGIKTTFWQDTFNLIKSAGNMSMFLSNTTDVMVDNIKELNQQTTDFAAEGDKLIQQALKNDEKLKKGAKKPTDGKGKADPLKDAQDKINANEALMQSEDELAEAQRARSEKVLEELKKEQEYKDKEHAREEKRLSDLQNLLDVFRKKKLISQKEYDKQTLALQTEGNNLEKTYLADKIARELKTQEEITKINNLNATDRMKLSEMERDVDAKSQKESLDRTIAEIQNAGQAKIKAYDTVLDELVVNGTMTMEEHNAKIIEFSKKVNQEVSNETDKAIADDLQKRREANLKKLDAELQFLEVRKGAVREGTHAYFDILREINDKAQEREIEALDKSLMTTEQYEKRKADIVAKYSKQRDDIRKQENRLMWQGVAQTLDALASISGALASSLDEESKKSKEAFEKRKKLQLATAIISAASGVIQILAQPSTLPSPFDWIVKAANVVALGVATAINIDKISSTTFEGSGGSGNSTAGFKSQGRNYGDGGMIDGPLHANGGVPITAEGGEAVMTRGSVAMFAPLLSAMNQMGGGTSFSKGASGQAFFDNPKVSNPVQESTTQIIKTYVVSNELTSEVEKQARLKALSTI